MSQTIQILRSTTAASPSTLENGELAYSSLSNKLFIGRPGGSTGDIDAIGGKAFMDLLDHTAGVLTASSALIVDANKKLDELLVDDLSLNGNTISAVGALKLSAGNNIIQLATSNYIAGGTADGSQLELDTSASLKQLRDGAVNLVVGTAGSATNTASLNNDGSFTVPSVIKTLSNTDLVLSPNGGGDLVLDGTAWPQTSGTNGYFLTTDGTSQSSWVSIIQATGNEIESVLDDPTPELGGDLSVNGKAIVSVSAGDIVITPDTTGSIVLDGQSWPQADGASGQYLKTDGAGNLAWASVASGSFDIAGDSGTDSFTTGQTLTFTGGAGITTSITDNVVTIASDITQYTNTNARSAISVTDAGGDGSLSYNAGTGVITYTGPSAAEVRAHFTAGSAITLASGVISIADGDIANVKLENSSVTVGTTQLALGATSTALAGLTELTVDNLNLNGNEISAATGDISLNPGAGGNIDANGSRVTGLAEPVNGSDAATKSYVDSIAEGLHVHASAHAILTIALTTITGDTVTYDNGLDGVGATLTLSTPLNVAGGDLDGDTEIVLGDRVIVAAEPNPAHNGIYILTSTSVLTRAADFDTAAEISGGDFVFITHGTQYGDTGWVLGEAVNTVGTDNVQWIQFSGAATFTAGEGMSQDGTTFSVNVAADGGIELAGGVLQLKSSLAGNGLTYTSGVVDVVGTANRISVTADAIDISTTYVGQTSITTLGTITTGTWNGDTITEAKGGTNQTSYTRGDILYASGTDTLAKLPLGTAGQFLVSDGTDVAWATIDGGTFV